MEWRELPPEVTKILHEVGASPRLIAHLTLVHDTAVQITDGLAKLWPPLKYDATAVWIGAATHDVGKALHKEELSNPGKQHEEIGPDLLIQHGLSPDYARFARTHARWQGETITLEDLLVSLADKIWKGQRVPDLETRLVKKLAGQLGQAEWEIYLKLDDLINEITQDSDARLSWQSQFSTI